MKTIQISFIYSFIIILLNSCAEEQLVVSPEENKGDNTITNIITTFMKSSGSILEGSEIRKENGKTIINPKKRITLKEFLNSQPIKYIKDTTFEYNSGIGTKSAPCNWRTHTYKVLDRFQANYDKSIGFMFPSNSEITWNILKTNYGFNQIIVNSEDYSLAINAGYAPEQIIVNLPAPLSYDQYSNVLAIINNPTYNNVLGFLIDEPLERNLYSTVGLKNLISSTTKNIFISSYSGTFYIDLTHYEYKSIKDQTSNSYLMCDLYYHWCGINRSPSDLWSLFYNEWYTGHNISNFLHIDCQNPVNDNCYSKWSGLFPLANTLGLSSLFLFSDRSYNLIDGTYCYCLYAFDNGWLRGFEEHVMIIEKCISPNCEHCQDLEDPEGENYWFIDQIIYFNDWWEVFP